MILAAFYKPSEPSSPLGPEEEVALLCVIALGVFTVVAILMGLGVLR